MLQCIDDTTNGVKTTFLFSDQSTVVATQQHNVAQTPFKLENPTEVSNEQKNAISAFSGCSTI
jgi:hypothetical protein